MLIDEKLEYSHLPNFTLPDTPPNRFVNEPVTLVFDAIVVTAANNLQCQAYSYELELRKQLGIIPPSTLVAAVPDPASVRVGSGGATMNALLVIAQRLCALAGFSYIDYDFLKHKKILLLHSGGDSKRIPIASVRGKAFCSLPCLGPQEELMSPIDLLLLTMYRICNEKEVLGGCFVASTDVLLIIPQDGPKIKWPQDGVTSLAIPANAEAYGPHHGVFKLSKHDRSQGLGKVEMIFQKVSVEKLKKFDVVNDGNVLVDSGVVYFSSKAVQKLLELHETPPLDSSTHIGIDHGSIPLRYELYTDILMSLDCGVNINEEDYISMSAEGYKTESDIFRLQVGRQLLWKAFHELNLYCTVANHGCFGHVGTTREYMDIAVLGSKFRSSFNLKKHARVFIDYLQDGFKDSVLMNCFLAGKGTIHPGALVEHSELRGNWNIKSGGLCSGIRSVQGLQVCENIAVQELHLKSESVQRQFSQLYSDVSLIPSKPWTLLIFGVFDSIKGNIFDTRSTFANRPWENFFHVMNLNPEDIWDASNIKSRDCSLWNARIFPILEAGERAEVALWLQYDEKPSLHTLRYWKSCIRISFEDALALADPLEEFIWRRELGYQLDLRHIECVLLNREDTDLLPVLRRTPQSRKAELLEWLDKIASHSPIDVASRALFTIADTLSTYPGTENYLRSGPSRNKAWMQAFKTLLEGDRAQAVHELSQQRSIWLHEPSDPQMIIRAARHYEGASQILIRRIVEQTPVYGATGLIGKHPALNEWREVTCPARIDLSGGWTDTLPISYEHGGLVINVAVNLDGVRPMGTKCRLIDRPIILIHTGSSDISFEAVECTHLDDFRDYSHPLAPGALVKSVLISLNIVSLEVSAGSLQEQLSAKLPINAGLEISTWSNLPKGSGLGTSSILAASALKSISQVVGRSYTDSEMVYLVLLVEQLMTTGGGWQDQVGGIYPGFKSSIAPKGLPVRVDTTMLDIPSEVVKLFEDHCLLVYTGVARLARYLLQNVLRRWAHRGSSIGKVFDGLCTNAEEMVKALQEGELAKIGNCLTTYWKQKSIVAQGSDVEPARVTQLILKLKSELHGYSLVGAGGGGFMVLITKRRNAIDFIKEQLSAEIEEDGVSVHSVQIDLKGWN